MRDVRQIDHVQMIRNDHVDMTAIPAFLSKDATENVRRFHHSVKGYAPTPLVSLEDYATAHGVRAVLVKDESPRFGLNAFKGAGSIYAVARVVCEELNIDPAEATLELFSQSPYKEKIAEMVFITTTDGNHGKGVSWAAGLLGAKSYVYMPAGTLEVRAQAIRDAGSAEVTITDLSYDDCVRYTAKLAEEKGWFLVQDTSWEGYEKVPAWIAQGYSTMVFEAAEQMRVMGLERPTHIFLQAGVGTMAGGVLGTVTGIYKDHIPVVSIVEPDQNACIFESARYGDGMPHKSTGSQKTIMAGLNCGEACTVTWPILDKLASYYFAFPDEVAERGMRMLAAPTGKDQKIISGESGAAPMGLVSLLLEKNEFKAYREELGIDQDAVILVISTEGATDPEGYRRVVG